MKFVALFLIIQALIAATPTGKKNAEKVEEPVQNKESQESHIDDHESTIKEDEPHTEDASMNSLEKHLLVMENRLVAIEEKVDHLLFHNSHDVTPHKVQMTPFGPQLLPDVKNPQSAHHQLKMHDFIRGAAANPYAYAGAMNGYGMAAMGGMGYPPIF